MNQNNNINGRERIMEERRRIRERRRRQMKIDRRCILIAGVVFFAVVCVNLFQFNRPTESQVEKRKLASFPSFSIGSFASGDFFEGINKFFADTFFGRDSIVAFSKKIDTLRGYDLSVGGEGSFVLLNPGANSDSSEEGGIGNILDNIDTEIRETEPKPSVDPNEVSLVLSKKQITLTVGGGVSLSADLKDADSFEWSVADSGIVEITPDGQSVSLKAKAEGETVVVCSSGEYTAECKVTVQKITSSGVNAGDTADFMSNGLFIYGDAVYTQSWYIEENASDYGRTLAYYKTIFPEATVSAIVSPTSAILIDNAEINSKLTDQKAVFDRLDELIGSQVNFVNPYGMMYAHRDEYIFFKSDHHWTQRGAYYAYKTFAESIGLEPASESDFDVITLTDSYSGSMYKYTQDERVKEFKDKVEAFMSKKKLTMTVTDRSGAVTEYDSAIMTWSESYSAFLCGDNPYTVINVPENPQNKNILVLKDSYGNALVPFLAENFGNIMIVDTRYSDINVKEMFADYELSDILFINNLEAANSPAWAKMYLKAAGVAVD